MQQSEISVTQLLRRFRTVFDRVALHKEPYILTRDGKLEVVMIPFDLWQRLQSHAEGRTLKSELYFDLGEEDGSSADEFLAWRERERERELRLEQTQR